MRKILILCMSLLVVFGLIGCSEQSEKVKYVKEMSNAIPSLTKSYAGLHDLYTKPLSYTNEEWKKEFRKHKAKIEDEYNDIKNLTPPLESLVEPHNSLVSALELTVDTNRVIDEQIQAGEKIDFANHLAKLNEMKAGMDQAITNIKELVGLK